MPSSPAPQGDSDPEPGSEPEREPTAEEKAEELRRLGQRDMETGTKSIAYFLAGGLIYGGIGWGLDHWLGTTFLLPIGIVVGMGLSLYLIWFRYGSG